MSFYLKDVDCGYGTSVVLHVGEVYFREKSTSLLVGHNGSGKTTFLKTICHVIPPLKGAVSRELSTCLLPEEIDFPGNLRSLTIFKSICPFEKFAGEILEELEVPLLKRFDQLSKGNRQKLRIAISESLGAGLSKTLLCLDEPLSGLDVVAREKIIKAWGGEGELGRYWKSFEGHRIISQHSGKAPLTAQTIAIHGGACLIFSPIENCDSWPDLIVRNR
jgi:ABC-type multidrug transport system ATPase subunit